MASFTFFLSSHALSYSVFNGIRFLLPDRIFIGLLISGLVTSLKMRVLLSNTHGTA